MSLSFNNYYKDVILQRLTQKTTRTSIKNLAFKYVNRSLIILNRTIDINLYQKDKVKDRRTTCRNKQKIRKDEQKHLNDQ